MYKNVNFGRKGIMLRFSSNRMIKSRRLRRWECCIAGRERRERAVVPHGDGLQCMDEDSNDGAELGLLQLGTLDLVESGQ